jgi:hypothetical protein
MLALATATVLAGFFLGRAGGPVIPDAMAQACCPTPAPVSSVLQDGPLFSIRDPAHDAPTSALNSVCGTPAISTGAYRELIVHVSSCASPIYAQFSLGQAGFVTQAPLACTPSTSADMRGAVVELDATMGSSFRLVTPPLKTGACPGGELKATIAGVR